MNDKFKTNVEKLYDDMVSSGNSGAYNIEELVDILLRRATRPLRVDGQTHSVRLTYYNVTIILARDLTSMQTVYNSDFQLTLHHIASASPHRLADFITALERDIPQWKHIWLRYDKLCAEKVKMSQRVNSTIRDIRHRWTKGTTMPSLHEREEFRIRYFNAKARQFLLEQDNPFWQNCRTEAEIIEQCLVYHVTPPVEQWLEEWTAIADACNAVAEEHQREREEQARAIQKARHLVNLKEMKLKGVLSTIEFHPSVCMSVHSQFCFSHSIDYALNYGRYVVCLDFCGLEFRIYISYGQIDSDMDYLVNALLGLNDLVPELEEAYAADCRKNPKVRLYGIGINSNYYWLDIPHAVVYLGDADRSACKVDNYSAYASTPVLKRMNVIVRDLFNRFFD